MPVRVTGNVYTHFLMNDFVELLEDIPLYQRQHLIFQHNGAPPHNALNSRRFLNENFAGR